VRRTLALACICAAVAACATRSVGEPSPQSPTLTRLDPESGPVGTRVTVTGTHLAVTGVALRFGAGYVKGVSAENGGTTIAFTVPESLDMCPPNPGGPCPLASPQTMPGRYAVAVIAGLALSRALDFTVTPR